MKNREKYRDEIVEAIKEDNGIDEKLCCFVQNNIIPRFVSEEDMEGIACGGMNCHTCEKMFAFWLDEEYIEPPVDWNKVPVDTLVRVRDYEDEKWYLRYFKGIADSSTYRFVTWASGATSITAYDDTESWKYCELLDEDHEETEDDWYNVPVDTPVRVRDDKRDMWILRHFKGIDDSRSDRYMAWTCGDTSKTSFGSYKHWEYCELVEDEDNDK